MAACRGKTKNSDIDRPSAPLCVGWTNLPPQLDWEFLLRARSASCSPCLSSQGKPAVPAGFQSSSSPAPGESRVPGLQGIHSPRQSFLIRSVCLETLCCLTRSRTRSSLCFPSLPFPTTLVIKIYTFCKYVSFWDQLSWPAHRLTEDDQNTSRRGFKLFPSRTEQVLNVISRHF